MVDYVHSPEVIHEQIREGEDDCDVVTNVKNAHKH